MHLKTWLADIRRLSSADIYWIVIWAMIYIGFLSLDIFSPSFWGSALLKYIGIFLCISYANQKYRSDYLLQLALAFTFLADTILVWTPFVVPGVFVFSFAQFLHLMRQSKLAPSTLGLYAFILSLVCALGVAFGLEPLYAIATVYGLQLICNVVTAFSNNRRSSKRFQTRCALYGFILFICCDFCVALRFLGLQGILDPTMLPLVSFLVWFFYYPSQVLIANSSNTQPAKTRKIAK